MDATDNVDTRYLLNDACFLAGKPLVSGSALRFEGQVGFGAKYVCLVMTFELMVFKIIYKVDFRNDKIILTTNLRVSFVRAI